MMTMMMTMEEEEEEGEDQKEEKRRNRGKIIQGNRTEETKNDRLKDSDYNRKNIKRQRVMEERGRK